MVIFGYLCLGVAGVYGLCLFSYRRGYKRAQHGEELRFKLWREREKYRQAADEFTRQHDQHEELDLDAIAAQIGGEYLRTDWSGDAAH